MTASSSSNNSVVEFKNQELSISEFTEKVIGNNVQAVRLEHVQLRGTAVDVESLAKWLRGHPSLQEWSLKHVTVQAEEDGSTFLPLDNAIACLLVSSADLQMLHLEDVTPKVETAALSTMAYCSTLRKLCVPHNRYTDVDVAWIADALGNHGNAQKLQTLDLSHNELSTGGAQHLERCLEKNTSLRELKLDGNPCSSQDAVLAQRISAKLRRRTATAA